MDLYIYRHGDTVNTNSLFKRFFGVEGSTQNLPILPKGVYALKEIAKFLKNTPTQAGFCSPYLRCIQSTQIVSGITNKNYEIDERITEFEGKEKFGSLIKRVDNFLKDVERKNFDSVSICTHGAVISAIKHLTKNGKFYYFQLFDYPSPGKLTIIKDGRTETLNFNN